MNIARGRFVLIGIVLGAAFWFIESVMHVYVFHGDDLAESIFSPGFHEAWMRLIIVGMFIAFGIYGQRLIYARRKAQAELSLANAELAQIFETSADGMRVVDRDFNMLRANDTFCRLAGIEKQEADGRKCYEVFRGPLCHSPGCPLIRILAGEDRVECDAVKIRDGHSEIPCIVTATPFREPTGELIGIVEDFKDISSRKQSEEELRQSRRQLRELASELALSVKTVSTHRSRAIEKMGMKTNAELTHYAISNGLVK